MDLVNRVGKKKLPPPCNESIVSIPIPQGDFKDKLEELRLTAFDYLMQCHSSRLERPLKHRPPSGIKRRITGFFAFKLYHIHIFYDLPLNFTSTLYSIAWDVCPHKHIWQAYAKQYSSYERSESFIDWLNKCPKRKVDSPFVCVFEKID